MATTVQKYFAFAHLPAHLQVISRPIGQLAELLEAALPDGPEKSTGMRKLLEAKDCMVRAALDALSADQLDTSTLITDTDRLQLLVSAVSENPPEIPDEVLDTVLGANQDATPEQIIKVIDAAILYLRSPSPQATATSEPVFNTEGPDDYKG
jgi:hypothetical protein